MEKETKYLDKTIENKQYIYIYIEKYKQKLQKCILILDKRDHVLKLSKRTPLINSK